jgi:hypothetical protein
MISARILTAISCGDDAPSRLHVLCNAPRPLAQQHIVPCAGSSWYVAPYRAASAAPVSGGVKMSSALDTIGIGAVSFVASTASDQRVASGHSMSCRLPRKRLDPILRLIKLVAGLHVLLTRSLFGDDIPRRLLLRVSLAKLTSALL